MTNPETPTPSRQHFIDKVQPMKISGKAMDWRAGWAVGLSVPGFFLLFLALLFGPLILLIFTIYLVLSILFWVTMVWAQVRDGMKRSNISMWYRKRSHKKRTREGDNFYTSEAAEIGEVFGIEDFDQPPPKPPPEIGTISYYPFLLDEKDPESIRGGAWDHRLNTDSASFWVAADSWLTQDPEEQEARLDGFSALLDYLARRGSLITRFAFQDVSLVGEVKSPREIARSLARDQGVLPSEELASYFRQATAMDEESKSHWTTFNISVDRTLTHAVAKRMGGPERLLAREALSFQKFFMGASQGSSPLGVKASGLLTHNDRIIDSRLKTDMVRGQWIHQRWARPDDVDHLLKEQLALPGSLDLEPQDYCVFGSTYMINFYIEEFPNGGMPPAAFWELVRVPERKVITVVFEMLPPWAALQMQELKTTTELSSNVDMSRSGRRVKERHRVSAERAVALEAGLAERKGQVGRVRAYITAIGSSLEEARRVAEKIEGAATEAPFYLELLTHRQEEGVNALLPVCRGLETSNLGTLLRK